MSERGVFAVDRGIWDHPILQSKEPFSRREAWLWLLSEATWKERSVYHDGRRFPIKRGQLAHSIRFMAEAWGWPKSNVSRFLAALKSDAMIGTDGGTGLTIITVCNYDSYQKVSLPNRDSDGTDTGTQTGQDRDKQEDRENKEDNNKIFPKSKSGWPKDFQERFWAAYPRRVGKKAAFRKLEIIEKAAEVPFERLLTAIGKIDTHDEKFIPHPTTWLNEGRYLDYVPLEMVAGATGPPKPPSPDLPSDAELRAKYADRRPSEDTSAESPDLLEESPRVSSDPKNRLGANPKGFGRISSVASLFPAPRMEAFCDTTDGDERYFVDGNAGGMARVVR